MASLSHSPIYVEQRTVVAEDPLLQGHLPCEGGLIRVSDVQDFILDLLETRLHARGLTRFEQSYWRSVLYQKMLEKHGAPEAAKIMAITERSLKRKAAQAAMVQRLVDKDVFTLSEWFEGKIPLTRDELEVVGGVAAEHTPSSKLKEEVRKRLEKVTVSAEKDRTRRSADSLTPEEQDRRGKAMAQAEKAIQALRKIPIRDLENRKRAGRIVTSWIRNNFK